ncbi:hypothetical protein [Streptomyces rapamycinicus]|uniref:Uncharacterized protein n=1 Tax=Streptomyces rapamycinicus TaxID=1226757 RepID=A0ABR6LMA6_9ACTN|nr:hypothetical protein [Streptomyces rapamycinicus]MBB4783472.1 hypothetical protein [Streptomyces rapamycinicus]
MPTPRARDAKGRGYPDNLPNVASLLPTPSTSEATGPGRPDGNRNDTLRARIALLPTPRASASENRQTKRTPSQEAGTHGKSLAAEVASLLATPMAGDAKGTRNATAGRKTDNPNVTPGWTLSDVVFSGQLLPTPRATDGTKGGPNQRGSKGDLTLPSAAHQIGASTDRPSHGGKRSSAAPHPGQLTLWDG